MFGLTVTKIIKVLPLILLLLVIPFLKTNENLDQGLLIRFLGLQFVLFLLILILVFSKRKSLQFIHSPLLLFYFIFVLYTGLHLLWGNVFSDSIFDWLKIVSYFLLLFLLIQLYSFDDLKEAIPIIISSLGIILGIYGAIELIQLLQNGKLSIPLDTYQVKTVFGHRNLYLQILFLSFPFQIYRILKANNRLLTIFHGIFAEISLFLLLVLSNRSVWLALIAGISFLIIIEFWRKGKNPTLAIYNKKKLRILLASGITILFLSGIFFIFFTETAEAEKHLSDIVKLENGSGKDRLELWNRTIKLIEEKPLLGHGAANWKIEMLKYGNKGLVSENNITFYQRPHNDFLWIFSEFGLLGGLLYLLGFVWTFLILISRILSRKENHNVLFYYAVLFALTGFIIFSFFSFPHERIVHNILLSTFFAVIITANLIDKPTFIIPKQTILKLLIYLVIGIILISSVIVGYQRYISESHTKKALQAKMANNHSLVISEINNAISPFYQMDPLSTPLSWYEGLAWYQLNQTDSALKYFSQAYQLNPYHIHVLNNFASAYGEKGESAKAISYYKEALTIYPEFEEASFNLCAVYFNIGKTDSAFAVLKNIDADTQNPKLKSFIKAVLKVKIVEILNEQNKKITIEDLPSNEVFYYQLYKTVIIENNTLKNVIFESSEISDIINSP